MIFIDTKSQSIYKNLATEYYFSREKILSDDVFMMWRNSSTLVIGKFQNALEEIDVKYAREKKITVARRLSGGGTVYQDLGCWQFTFISPSAGDQIEFGRFIEPMVDVLSALGLDAKATGRNDITVSGKKVSGNTQYKLGAMTVHHGTLLFSTDLSELVRSCTPNPYKITSKAISSVRERVTNISEHLSGEFAGMTAEDFRDFTVSRLTCSEYEITAEDSARIDEIAREKFDNERVIYSASPKFEIEKELHASGGNLVLGYSVVRGKITEAGIRGDFFAASDEAEKIAAALVGVEFTPEAVFAALSGFENILYKISVRELADGFFE